MPSAVDDSGVDLSFSSNDSILAAVVIAPTTPDVEEMHERKRFKEHLMEWALDDVDITKCESGDKNGNWAR